MEERISRYIIKRIEEHPFGRGNPLAYEILLKLTALWVTQQRTESDITMKIDLLTSGRTFGIESPEIIFNTLQ